MRRSRSALMYSSNVSTLNLSTTHLTTPVTTNLVLLISCMLICATLSFAAAPDRITGPIDSRQTIPLAKSLHPQAQPQYDRGPVDPSRQLSYITLLTSPSASQQRALDQLLAQQQDRTSPNYHKWLTPQQYADRFGLSPNDLTRITTWLMSQGFQILSIGGGRNSIVFSGTAAEVQRAFGTEIHNYTVNGEEHFANSMPLMIPSALNGIVTTVIGLHDFRALPANHGKSLGGARNARPDYYDANYVFPNYLAPGDIATIYDINPLYNATTPIDGAGQKLAIVGQTDIYLSDINDFRSGFGLSTIPTTGAGACTTNSVTGIVISPCSTTIFDYVLLGTDPGAPSSGDLGEADLDIEWSGAVAFGAQIVFVNGETAGGVYDALTAVINPPSGPPLAPVVSMSYGYCEIGAPDLESLLQEGNTEGVTILNSAGDVGSTACDYNPPNSGQPFSGAQFGLAVSYPASSPEVTGVGGTGISLANDSYPNPSAYWGTPNPNPANGGTAVSYIPELPWNDDEEFVLYCHAPYTGDTFCSTGGGTTGWVPLTSTATGAQVQEDIWIYQGGGGASNCWYLTAAPQVCLGAGAGPTGGGFAQPLYQQGLSVASAPSGVRYVPDVSMLASPSFPGYIYCTSSSCASGIFTAVDAYNSVVGGTSASTPVFAGIVTLLNQDVVQSGLQSAPGLGNINPALYNLAAHNPTAFHQVTTGDNMVYCQPTLPTGFPSNVVCPAAIAPATQGVFGYEASNKDSATGYNLVAGLGSVDANNLATAWMAAAVATTTTTVASSQNPSNFGAAVTFTATVTTAGANAPTGSVTFYNGTTSLGTGTLSNLNATEATATFTTLAASPLPSGTDSITAAYGGDTKNASSTSAVLTQTVNAPTFTFANTGSASRTGLAGQTTLAYTFLATPTSGATFAGPVTFGCTFIPADPTLTNTSCAFTPASIAAGTSSPSGTTVTMTITTAGPNTGTGSQLRRRADNRSPWLPLTLPIAGLVMLGLMRGKAGRRVSKQSAIALLSFSLVVLGFMVACGGSSSPPPPVTVTVTPSSTVNLYANEAGNAWPASATQQQFSAMVNNSTSQTVTWAVTGGNANGTITSAGLYTSPATVPNPATVTVTATSSAATTPGSGTVDILTPTAVGTFTVTVTATEATTAVPATPAPTLVVQ